MKRKCKRKARKTVKRKGQDSGKRSTCFPPKIRRGKMKNKSLLLRIGQDNGKEKARMYRKFSFSRRSPSTRAATLQGH